MIRLQKLSLAMAFCLIGMAIQAQNDQYQNVYASSVATPNTTTISDARVDTANKFAQQGLVSESFLDARNGYIGIVFSEKVVDSNIYYKIVDSKGKEIYNGSAHAHPGSNPTLYYNTQNLPSGVYRLFMENNNFFMSTSFAK